MKHLSREPVLYGGRKGQHKFISKLTNECKNTLFISVSWNFFSQHKYIDKQNLLANTNLLTSINLSARIRVDEPILGINFRAVLENMPGVSLPTRFDRNCSFCGSMKRLCMYSRIVELL